MIWLRNELSDIRYGFTHAIPVIKANVLDLMAWLGFRLPV